MTSLRAQLLTLAGCAADTVSTMVGGRDDSATTVTATLGGREVVATSRSANVLYVRPEENEAVFQIDNTTITVKQTQVSWGANQSITLPAKWKQIQFVESGNRIAILVDDKSFGQIHDAS